MLAHLPEREKEADLAAGPFPSLPSNTITDPDALRSALDEVLVRGIVTDDQEIAADLTCFAAFAAPLCIRGEVVAAISVALDGAVPEDRRRAHVISCLLATAAQIDAALAGWQSGPPARSGLFCR